MISTSTATGSGITELEWSDLTIILAICRAGTLSGAARTLKQNHSTVFRRINAIENKTGVRFFERLPDGYRMTDAGQTAMRYAERIENEVHALSREVLGQDTRLQGKIVITAPEGMTAQLLPPLLADFCRMHPEVTIELAGGLAAFDLARREADIAIRATRKPPDASLGRKICDFRFAIYSSPKYLKRNKDKPLHEQQWVLIPDALDWLVPHVWKKKEQGERQVVLASSSTLAVTSAVAAGMGVTAMSCYVGDADRRLVRVLDPIEAMTIELWVLTHPDLRHTARVKALMTHLVDALKKEADLFEGARVNKTKTGKK